jgi:hypothetical protein
MKIELSETQKENVLQYVNANNKIPCVKALQVARELKIDPKNMLHITDDLGIKIGDCELGVFGDKEVGEIDTELYNKILTFSDENKKVTCPSLWEEAKNSNMKNVRSTVNGTDLFVTYCQLGCFEEGRKKWKQK